MPMPIPATDASMQSARFSIRSPRSQRPSTTMAPMPLPHAPLGEMKMPHTAPMRPNGVADSSRSMRRRALRLER
eukprot:4463065-Prymnesium_polylepis.1